MKQTILILLFILMGGDIWAGDPKFIVWFRDGTTAKIPIDEKIEFVYNKGIVMMKSDHINLLWPLSNVKKITFEDMHPSGLKEIPKQQFNVLSDRCMVYDLNGKLIKMQIRTLSELPKGIYIIKDENKTIKVLRK
jgi:hypothetical protein